MELIGADRSPAEEMPAARAGKALHAGLDAADRDGAGRGQQSRILPARHVQRFLQSTEIGPARRKADHGDAIIARDMPCHDVIGRGVECLGYVLEVDAVFAAIGNRNAPASGFGRSRHRPLRQRQQLFAEHIEADRGRIIVHQQRPIGRYRLGYARDRFGGMRAVERKHPPIGGIVDVPAEFHRDGAVAAR